MTCLARLPRTTTLPAYEWEYLRKLLLKVRWPGLEDPYVRFALAQGALIGLRMAGVITDRQNHQAFMLLSNAQDCRLAEGLKSTNKE